MQKYAQFLSKEAKAAWFEEWTHHWYVLPASWSSWSDRSVPSDWRNDKHAPPSR